MPRVARSCVTMVNAIQLPSKTLAAGSCLARLRGVPGSGAFGKPQAGQRAKASPKASPRARKPAPKISRPFFDSAFTNPQNRYVCQDHARHKGRAVKGGWGHGRAFIVRECRGWCVRPYWVGVSGCRKHRMTTVLCVRKPRRKQRASVRRANAGRRPTPRADKKPAPHRRAFARVLYPSDDNTRTTAWREPAHKAIKIRSKG